MPTMDKQQVLEAVEKAITEGGNIVIRFGWGQMRTLRQEEAELLLAALKPSQSYVGKPAWETCVRCGAATLLEHPECCSVCGASETEPCLGNCERKRRDISRCSVCGAGDGEPCRGNCERKIPSDIGETS